MNLLDAHVNILKLIRVIKDKLYNSFRIDLSKQICNLLDAPVNLVSRFLQMKIIYLSEFPYLIVSSVHLLRA